jgi:ribosomal protein S10
MSKKQIESFSAKETKRRVKAAVRGAFKTPPKPLKSMTLKRPRAQRDKKAKF